MGRQYKTELDELIVRVEGSDQHWANAGWSHEEIMEMVDRQLGYYKKYSGEGLDPEHKYSYSGQRVFSGGDQLRYACSREIAAQLSNALNQGMTPIEARRSINIPEIVNEKLLNDYPRPGISNVQDLGIGPSEFSR